MLYKKVVLGRRGMSLWMSVNVLSDVVCLWAGWIYVMCFELFCVVFVYVNLSGLRSSRKHRLEHSLYLRIGPRLKTPQKIT